MNPLNKESVTQEQQRLFELGYYTGSVDGLWGNKSKQALLNYEKDLQLASKLTVPNSVKPVGTELPWGAKVSQVFKDRVNWIANALEMPANGAAWLMGCMAWESGESFSPSVKNMAGSGATGLIQFMPATAKGLGTTTDKLAQMTAEDQLNYVYKYFAPYKGRLNNLADVYMAILWPAAVGKPLAAALWSKQARPTTYRQNAGLDTNKDGVITKAEAVQKVQAKLDKGYTAQYLG